MGLPVATPYEKAAWIVMAVALTVALLFHLVPGLVAGLLVSVLLSRLARGLAGRRLSHGRAKWLAALLTAVLAIGAVTGVVLFLVGLLRGHLVGDVPALFQKMADVLDDTRDWIERRGGGALLPEALRDTEDVQGLATEWLRGHATELRKMGGEIGRGVLHAAFGVAIGVLLFFHPPAPTGPLGQALAERFRRLAAAFQAVLFAQVRISALNTSLTAIYLLVVLPLFGVHLPFAGTLVAVTFLTGLLPVVGNLISNTVIVIISLGVSGWVAVASLAFLVGIHKLEYFANARIVGGEIRASAWELLTALIALEAVFGLPGLVMAPVLYAYVKGELADRGLV